MFIFGNAVFLKRAKSCQNTTFAYTEIALSLILIQAIQHSGITEIAVFR